MDLIVPLSPFLLSLWLSLNLSGCSSSIFLLLGGAPTMCLTVCSPSFSSIPSSLLNLCLPLLNPGSLSKGCLYLVPGKALQTKLIQSQHHLSPFPWFLSSSPQFSFFLLKAQLSKWETPIILFLFYVILHPSPRQLVLPLKSILSLPSSQYSQQTMWAPSSLILNYCDSFLTSLPDSALTSPAHSRILFIQHNLITSLSCFKTSSGFLAAYRTRSDPSGGTENWAWFSLCSHHLPTSLQTFFPSRLSSLTTFSQIVSASSSTLTYLLCLVNACSSLNTQLKWDPKQRWWAPSSSVHKKHFFSGMAFITLFVCLPPHQTGNFLQSEVQFYTSLGFPRTPAVQNTGDSQ